MGLPPRGALELVFATLCTAKAQFGGALSANLMAGVVSWQVEGLCQFCGRRGIE